MRFRCHTGHAFTADSLLAELSEATDQVIWSAVRSLQEGAMLLGHLAEHWEAVDPVTADHYRLKARAAIGRADLIRKAVADHEPVGSEDSVEIVQNSS